MAGRVEANLPGLSLSLHSVYCKCITRKYLTLKMKVKVTEYNTGNGPIRLTFIKVKLEHFSLALTVFEIFTLKTS